MRKPHPGQVVVVAQLPPPVHGQSIVNQAIVEVDPPGAELHVVDLNVSTSVADVSRPSLRKLLRTVAVAARASGHALRGRRDLLVYPVGARNRSGLLRDAVVLTLLRPWFGTRLLHVHTSAVGLLDDLPGPLRRWCRFAYRDAIVVYLDESLRDDDSFPAPRRVAVIPNGVGAPTPGPPSDRSGRATSTVLFLSNLYPSKGPREVVDAIEALTDEGLAVRADVVGGSTAELPVEALRREVAERGLADHVTVVGPAHGAAKAELMRQADIFCLPTTYEGEAHPLTVLEALGAGLPVVATRWRAIPSIVDDGRTGLLVEPGSADELVAAIRTLVTDPDLRASMSTAARTDFEERFTLERFRERFHTLIREVLDDTDSDSPVSEVAAR